MYDLIEIIALIDKLRYNLIKKHHNFIIKLSQRQSLIV